MATNYVKASYTEVIDLQTTNGKTSIIGIHTPVGAEPYRRLMGFFTQFRKYRYRGISSLVMVPAANLPVDPLGLTGVVGTTDLMDPRDNLNPILFHGVHGSSLSNILNSIYSADEYVNVSNNNVSDVGRNVSPSTSESGIANSTSDGVGAYYRCLTDVTWKKFGIQNGVKLRGLHPLVHKLARNLPLLPSVAISHNGGQIRDTYIDSEGKLVEVPANKMTDPSYPIDTFGERSPVTSVENEIPNVVLWDGDTAGQYGPAYAQEFTNGMQALSWLPTATMNDTSNTGRLVTATMLPKLFMGVLVLPPAYNVEQYFRMVIRHEFEFKDFSTSLGLLGFGAYNVVPPTTATSYYNWIDYSDAKAVKEQADKEGVDSVGGTIDMIGGDSTVISDGVS